MADALYSVDKECPVCEKIFKLTKMRGKQILIKQDSDFCSWFKDVNPYYYSIWSCPHCNYASPEENYGKFSAPNKEKLKQALSNIPDKVDLCGERDLEKAVASYEQAVFCYETIGALDSRFAEVYLKAAWIYRQNDQAEAENIYLEKAIEKYDSALSKERLPIGNLSALAVTYLIGELSRRMGNIEKASLYFSRIISDPMAKLEPKVFNMTRDAWQEIRNMNKQ